MTPRERQQAALNDLTHHDSHAVTYAQTDVGNIKDWCPTFLPDVDRVMLGGIPLSGKVTEIFGDPSVGKTTLALTCIRNLIKGGAIVEVFDIEGTTSNHRMAELGVDYHRVIHYQPSVDRKGKPIPITIEDIFHEITHRTVEISNKFPGMPIVFFWDTVADTPADAQVKNGGSKAIGRQAAALSNAFKFWSPLTEKCDVSLVCLNQARTDPGAVQNKFTGPKIKTTGGKALGHAVSLELVLKHHRNLKESGSYSAYGHQTRIKFKKSKIGDNMGAYAEMDILSRHGKGCDFVYNLYDEARTKGLITGTSWQSYASKAGKVLKKQGSKNMIAALRANPKVCDEIWQRLIKFDFPNCYPPLFNLTLQLTPDQFPFLKGMQPYYICRQEKQPVDSQNYNYRMWKRRHPKEVKKALSKSKKK